MTIDNLSDRQKQSNENSDIRHSIFNDISVALNTNTNWESLDAVQRGDWMKMVNKNWTQFRVRQRKWRVDSLQDHNNKNISSVEIVLD